MREPLTILIFGIAALLLAAATGLGAYAAHGLDRILDDASLASFQVAVDYQFFHALGLIGVALYGQRRPETRFLTGAAALLLVGIVLFCGGVYASSLGGPRWIAHLAPVGGVSLISGWAVVAFCAVRDYVASMR